MSDFLRPGSVVLDLGMNRGEFARTLTDRWQCRVFGLEPVPELVHDLREQGLHVVNKALAGEDGPVDLHVSTNLLASSVVAGFVDDAAPVTTVAGVSLTTFMSELDVHSVELAKFDVEGAEFDAFDTTGDATLLRIRQFTVEFHDFIDPARFKDRVDRISERMEALGFARIKFTLSNFDVVYLHPDLMLRRSDLAGLNVQKYAMGAWRRLVHREVEEEMESATPRL